ncbi:hypothetical protein PSEWESI4_02238 [Pseudomonas carbonaria]|uniref:Beta-lactamase-related domain-containing protein n=2 Tax=Zestomonas carbonaria TaxID=2762745 RepID=A0A7U7EN23_9GAMM|nr:hypothetical protein PSEWESI4_02238 [Pseudomonas carbonaria]
MRLFRFPVLLLLVGGVLVVSTVAHFWITDRLGISRAFYSVEAVSTRWSINCSAGSPDWMHDAVRRAIGDNYSLSNQLAYIDWGGHLHHCESGWLRGMLTSPRLNHEHRFRYASTTKLFTADTILKLVDAGQLSLDDRLVDLLPEIGPVVDGRLASVTIEHLLMHRAGFDRIRSPDPMFLDGQRPWCPYNIGQLARMRLDFAPGERQVYSNLGYCLLGMVIERVTGESYRAWVSREYALDDADIRFVDGGFFDDEVSYDFRNSDVYGEWYSKYFDFNALSSAAGLSGSAEALARVVRGMVLRSSLNLTSYDVSPDCDETVLRSCYGYAFYKLRKPKRDFYIHVQPGFLYGMSAVALVDSKGGVLVWLGNGMPRAGDAVGDNMTVHLLDVLTDHYARQAGE